MMITHSYLTVIEAAGAAGPGGGAPLPTLMLFSSDLPADSKLLRRFALGVRGTVTPDGVQLAWALPDPDLPLGTVTLSRREAAKFAAINSKNGALRALLAGERDMAGEKQLFTLTPLYVDWTGLLTRTPLPENLAAPARVTGLAERRARAALRQQQYAQAAALLLDALALARRDDGRFHRRASYTIHAAAVLAEAMGSGDAWEYFETVALMIYPNNHDALIGLALRAADAPGEMLRLLARAYAIRPNADDLALFARAAAKHSPEPPEAIAAALRDHAAGIDLDAPLLRDPGGQPLHVPPAEIIAHLQALA